jgi:hypothetical protein
MAKGYQKMTETETETRELGQPPEIDRVALLHSLDLLISRLRNGLELPQAPSDKADINGVIE